MTTRPYTQRENMWRVRSVRVDHEKITPLRWAWEVHMDPISDDYLPEEISAYALFNRWYEYLWNRGDRDTDLIHILWLVRGKGIAEFPPAFGSYHAVEGDVRYDRFYHLPISTRTGEEIDWSRVPIDDKLWHPGRADKGGFIQEATRWKPSLLQPSVPLGLLRGLADARA